MADDTGSALLERVRAAIARLDVTYTEFAERIGIDASKLSKSLSGARRFTSLELALIAEECDTTTDWLLRGTEPTLPALAARMPNAPAGTADLAYDRAKEFDGAFSTLKRLGCTTNVPELPRAAFTGNHVRDGSALAHEALAFVDREGQSSLLREDPAVVLETVFGINVAVVDIGPDVDGLAWQRDDFRLILVTNQIGWSRQWFTIAHEFGHVLAGDAQNLHIDRDIMSPTERRRASEMRANAFAAAFTMPEQYLVENGHAAATDVGFATMSGTLKVSPSALAWRLLNLGLIDDERRAVLGGMSTQSAARLGGWTDEFRKLTEQQSRPRVPRPLAEQAFTAWSEGIISVRPLAAILGVPPESMLPSPAVAVDPSDTVADEPVFVP